MMKQECIPLDAPDDWGEALGGLRHAFAHTWEYCHAMYLTTGNKTFLYHLEEDGIHIVCPFIEWLYEGTRHIATPMGFSGFTGNRDYPDLSRHWKKYIAAKGYICGYLVQNPIFNNHSYFGQDELIEYNSTYTLDLTLEQGELDANLDRNRRRQLGNREHLYDELIHDRITLKKFFLENYTQLMRRNNASISYQYTQETLEYLCDLENVLLVGAGSKEKPQSVFLFACTPHAGESFLAASLPEGRKYSFALTWYAVEFLRSQGVPVLNLGGGVTDNDGIAQFKQRFGSNKLPLKCMRQVYNTDVYENLCRKAGNNPDDMTGYFPPYIRP